MQLAQSITEKKTEALAALGEQTLLSFGSYASMHTPIEALESQEVGDTLAQLDAFQISAVAVVNDQRELVANFGVTDLVALWHAEGHSVDDFNLSLRAYLNKHSSKSLTPLTAQRTDKLAPTLVKMIDQQVHRIWLVDEDKKSCGVFTFTDLFKIVANYRTDTSAKHTKRSAFGALVRSVDDNAALSISDAGDALELRAEPSDEHSLWSIEHGPNSLVELKNGDKYLGVVDNAVVLVDTASPASFFNLIYTDTGFAALHHDQGGFVAHKDGAIVFESTSNNIPQKAQCWRVSGAFSQRKEPPTV